MVTLRLLKMRITQKLIFLLVFIIPEFLAFVLENMRR